VRYLRIYERKNETISPNPLQDSQDQERKKETKYDFKEIKSCAKRRKKNSSAKKKRANSGPESSQIDERTL